MSLDGLPGDSSVADELALRLGFLSDVCRDLHRRLDAEIPSGWHGVARAAFVERRAAVLPRLLRTADAYQRAAEILARYAAEFAVADRAAAAAMRRVDVAEAALRALVASSPDAVVAPSASAAGVPGGACGMLDAARSAAEAELRAAWAAWHAAEEQGGQAGRHAATCLGDLTLDQRPHLSLRQQLADVARFGAVTIAQELDSANSLANALTGLQPWRWWHDVGGAVRSAEVTVTHPVEAAASIVGMPELSARGWGAAAGVVLAGAVGVALTGGPEGSASSAVEGLSARATAEGLSAGGIREAASAGAMGAGVAGGRASDVGPAVAGGGSSGGARAVLTQGIEAVTSGRLSPFVSRLVGLPPDPAEARLAAQRPGARCGQDDDGTVGCAPNAAVPRVSTWRTGLDPQMRSVR